MWNKLKIKKMGETIIICIIKKVNVELEVITDVDVYQFIENVGKMG